MLYMLLVPVTSQQDGGLNAAQSIPDLSGDESEGDDIICIQDSSSSSGNITRPLTLAEARKAVESKLSHESKRKKRASHGVVNNSNQHSLNRTR
jgi:hypothetical protein